MITIMEQILQWSQLYMRLIHIPYNSFKMAAISIQFKFYDADLFI